MGQWITYGEREMNFDGGEKESLIEMRKEYWLRVEKRMC
jgi:hypothetical protein